MNRKFMSVLLAAGICLSSTGAAFVYADRPASALSVIAPVTEVNAAKNTITVGEELPLYVGFGDGAEPMSVDYVSSDTAVATVNAQGIVKGVGVGTAEISVSSQGNLGSDVKYTVNVKKKQFILYAVPKSIQTVNQKDTIAVGESVGTTVEWEIGQKETLIYSSSDENVAQVDSSGVITGIGEGTAVISVKTEGLSKTVQTTINVSNSVRPSVCYNTSELKPRDKLCQYDTLHYDQKDQGSYLNILTDNDSYYYGVSILSRDYVLPFNAEVVGKNGLTIYLLPENCDIPRYDCHDLSAGETILTDHAILCYDYTINKCVLPVFLPNYYSKYIGNGKITVKDIDHENKTITLEAEHESLDKYIRVPGLDVIKKAPMFSGNQALLKINTREYLDGCIVTPNKFKWIITGTAEADQNSGYLYGDISEDTGEAAAYCLINAKSPGELHITAQEYSDISGTPSFLNEYHFNLTVNEDGNFASEFTTVKPIIAGDIDGSGKPDIYDMMQLKSWISKVSDSTIDNWEAADMNGDGKINVIDYIMMKRTLIKQAESRITLNDIYELSKKARSITWEDLQGFDYTDKPYGAYWEFPINDHYRLLVAGTDTSISPDSIHLEETVFHHIVEIRDGYNSVLNFVDENERLFSELGL